MQRTMQVPLLKDGTAREAIQAAPGSFRDPKPTQATLHAI